MYFEYFTDGCILQNPIPAVIIKIFGKWLENVLRENLPLPEHKHFEILDRGGLWDVDN